MCRLFAQLSEHPAGVEDLLIESEFSLLKQSNFKKDTLQKDGWGIAHFGNNGEPAVSKSPKPAFKDASAFRTAAAGAVSKAVIGHIRAASNPRKLPKTRLINMDNTQPFTDGRWVFAHNGTLQIPLEVTRGLGPYAKKLKSLNDSEVYFWQFVKFHDKLKDVEKALLACVEETWALWRSCAKDHPAKKAPYTGLNTLLSDGKSLHALCHAASKGMAECGVCNPTQPWGVMSFTRRGGRLVVASENLDRGQWTRLDCPELLSARLGPRGLEIRRRRYELSSSGLVPRSSPMEASLP
ncbi:MAG: class II glutamine amidotransferase [Elusimicrobia bacterium]|nr:class II glutamine amidotransferase [Elusimicrobiota bacterium]